jgi:hypothetical protein
VSGEENPAAVQDKARWNNPAPKKEQLAAARYY